MPEFGTFGLDYMGLVDKEHQKKSERSAKRLALAERRKKRLLEADKDIDRIVFDSSTSTSGDEGSSVNITAENTEKASNQP